MSHLRALVVDDEPLARQRICTLLSAHDDVAVVGECQNGQEATRALKDGGIDLVFLDIEMPELDGFGVVDALPEHNRPAIIFVTAYNEHAVRAFDINALDYLLKPYDEPRFSAALDRARAQLKLDRDERQEFEQRMMSALSELRGEGYIDRLAVKSGDQIVLVDVNDIDWIEAAGKHVRIHAGSSEHLLREPLQHLQDRLDPRKFARIHRSTIINLDAVQSLEPAFHGEFRVSLKDGTELTMSRGYRAKLRERFGNQF